MKNVNFVSSFLWTFLFITSLKSASALEVSEDPCRFESVFSHGKEGKKLKLESLVFYAIDKASPYSVCRSEIANAFEKISHLSLYTLQVHPHDEQMWVIINATLRSSGFRSVFKRDVVQFFRENPGVTPTPSHLKEIIELKNNN